MCVSKIIAEPERRGPRDTKQGGVRGNTIAFPHAKLELCGSTEMPPPPEEATRFMSQSVVIALAGVEKDDLHNARWAEIPRQDYIDAARVCTAHSMAYDGCSLNEERAWQSFGVRGRTSEAVLQQAARVTMSAELQHRLEGPADAGCASMSAEQIAAVDGVEVEEDTEDEGGDNHAALPEEEFPQMALPSLHICADAVSSGDVDELHAVRKVYAELEELQRELSAKLQADIAACHPKVVRARSLQEAVRALKEPQVRNGILQAGEALEMLEESPGDAPWEAYAVQGPSHFQCTLHRSGQCVFRNASHMGMVFLGCLGQCR